MSYILAAYPDTRYLKTKNSVRDTYWYPSDKLHVTLAYFVDPEPAIVSHLSNLRLNFHLKLWFAEKSEFMKGQIFKMMYKNVCIVDNQPVSWNSFIKNSLQSFGLNESQLSAFAQNDGLHMSIGQTKSSYCSTVEVYKNLEPFWVPILEFKYYCQEKVSKNGTESKEKEN